MRRALIASFDFIQQFIFELPKMMGVQKAATVRPMPEELPVYEKDRLVEYRGTVDLTRKLSDSSGANFSS
jgi:hypothetical protein